jgi:hypothetical protein
LKTPDGSTGLKGPSVADAGLLQAPCGNGKMHRRRRCAGLAAAA